MKKICEWELTIVWQNANPLRMTPAIPLTMAVTKCGPVIHQLAQRGSLKDNGLKYCPFCGGEIRGEMKGEVI